MAVLDDIEWSPGVILFHRVTSPIGSYVYHQATESRELLNWRDTGIRCYISPCSIVFLHHTFSDLTLFYFWFVFFGGPLRLLLNFFFFFLNLRLSHNPFMEEALLLFPL